VFRIDDNDYWTFDTQSDGHFYTLNNPQSTKFIYS